MRFQYFHVNFVLFFDLDSECFAYYDAFCLQIFDYACLRRNKTYCDQRGLKLWKNVYIKNIFENGWWEDAYSSSYPLDTSCGNHQKSLAYFSHLAPLVLFLLLKSRDKMGGHGTMPPLNTFLPRSLKLGARERIISSPKGG